MAKTPDKKLADRVAELEQLLYTTNVRHGHLSSLIHACISTLEFHDKGAATAYRAAWNSAIRTKD